jgi:hypothetical protein
MKNIISIIFLFTYHFAVSQTFHVASSTVAQETHKIYNTSFLKGDSFTAVSFSPIGSKENLSVKPFPNQNKVKSFILPAALITYGIVALNNNAVRNLDITTSRTIKDGNINFKNNADNYLQYAPAFAVYGLNAVGVKGKNNFGDRSIMYGMSTIITGGIVYSIKSISKVDRPDGSANNSFPSGHTTSAFVAAEFLHQEYKHRSPIYSILGYAAATTTGILRMYNNKHYLSDVIAGAGFGILSTKLVYFAYPFIKGKITGRKSLLAQHVMVVP